MAKADEYNSLDQCRFSENAKMDIERKIHKWVFQRKAPNK